MSVVGEKPVKVNHLLILRKNIYLRKRVQICAISEKPSAGKCCRLNRNPTEKRSVLKSWLSRNWSVRFENLSLRATLKKLAY